MTRTKSKGYRAPKRGAEEDHLDSSDSRRSKRRLAYDGLEAASESPTVALSAEELFKLKNSGEFDINDEEKNKHVEVKDEPAGDSGHASHVAKQLSSVTVPQPRRYIMLVLLPFTRQQRMCSGTIPRRLSIGRIFSTTCSLRTSAQR